MYIPSSRLVLVFPSRYIPPTWMLPPNGQHWRFSFPLLSPILVTLSVHSICPKYSVFSDTISLMPRACLILFLWGTGPSLSGRNLYNSPIETSHRLLPASFLEKHNLFYYLDLLYTCKPKSQNVFLGVWMSPSSYTSGFCFVHYMISIFFLFILIINLSLKDYVHSVNCICSSSLFSNRTMSFVNIIDL